MHINTGIATSLAYLEAQVSNDDDSPFSMLSHLDRCGLCRSLLFIVIEYRLTCGPGKARSNDKIRVCKEYNVNRTRAKRTFKK